MLQWLFDLLAWWQALSPDLVFLFALPFAVAAAGLLRESLQP